MSDMLERYDRVQRVLFGLVYVLLAAFVLIGLSPLVLFAVIAP